MVGACRLDVAYEHFKVGYGHFLKNNVFLSFFMIRLLLLSFLITFGLCHVSGKLLCLLLFFFFRLCLLFLVSW